MSGHGRYDNDLGDTGGFAGEYDAWPNVKRILFVIDGRINLTKTLLGFGLGYVLDTLFTTFPWWTQFRVDVAKRDGHLRDEDLGSYVVRYWDFKFTNSNFNLDSYDQVWFFGDHPNDGDVGEPTDADIPSFHPLENAELRLLAEWMDRGGGVFATGDHGVLGASMCSRIPRVRTMRRWTQAQGVPTIDGNTRHQTLQPNPQIQDADALERDTTLQPIELVYRRVGGQDAPHPILSSPRGPIDRFPDHMHEGEVIADGNVRLDLPLDIPGYDRPEYPFTDPGISPSLSNDDWVLPPRPRPHVIAYGRTTNKSFTDEVVQRRLITSGTPQILPTHRGSKRFGLVGVYDGDAVGLGRVVVDSTWHHWFSYNLVGIATEDAPAYEKMQAYYRNVAIWLATPSQRQSMLISGIWGVLTGSPPMRFTVNDSPWEIGERVLITLGKTVSGSLLGELVASFLDQGILAALARPIVTMSEPSCGTLSADIVNRAVVGGIGRELLDLALDHRQRRSRGKRSRLDPDAIRQRATNGVTRGLALLRQSINDAATALTALHANLEANATPRQIDIRIPIETRTLRIVAETLQLPDPKDPVLIGDHVTITIRVRLDGDVVGCRTFEGIELPSLDERGGVLQLNCDLGKVEVQTNETLTIEVLAGCWKSTAPDPEVFRFRETLRSDPSSWIGKRVPARAQAWRLWYRIEESSPPSNGAREGLY